MQIIGYLAIDTYDLITVCIYCQTSHDDVIAVAVSNILDQHCHYCGHDIRAIYKDHRDSIANSYGFDK